MSQLGNIVVKHKAQKPGSAGGNAKTQTVAKKASKTSTVSAMRKQSKPAVASSTKISPRSQQPPTQAPGSGSKTNVSAKTTKKAVAKPYEPIRLPEDILTIQAHSVSTPVTELPYLLIAAHIGSLPTTRQFYPPTSAFPTPLTVFRDMFVMTIDVRGFKPTSIRLSTEGQLIIIEGLQSDVPQVVFTQTGTIDPSDKYVMDPTPNLSSMPVHTTFNYVQHRVKLPDDFSEEGLRVGLDDVSGHVVITGRLVHDHKSSFPEPWNKNKVTKRGRRPLINTVNLSREDARKLAAFHAVQGSDDENSQEIANTTLLGFGKKQWLEREGAKLRAIQHKALKENIRRLTEMKKSMSARSSRTTLANKSKSTSEVHHARSQTDAIGAQHQEGHQLRPDSIEPGKVVRRNKPQAQQQQDTTSPTAPALQEPTAMVGAIKSKARSGTATPQPAANTKLAKTKSRIVTAAEAPKVVKRKSVIIKPSASSAKVAAVATKKKSMAKLEPKGSSKKPFKVMTDDNRARRYKVSFKRNNSEVDDDDDDDEGEDSRDSENQVVIKHKQSEQATQPSPVSSTPTTINATKEPDKVELNPEPAPAGSPSVKSRNVSRTSSNAVQQISRKSSVTVPSQEAPSKSKSKDSLGSLVPKKSKSKQGGGSRTESLTVTEQSAASSSGTETKSGAQDVPEEDPIGKQDKAMWEKLLSYAGVHRRGRQGK